MEHTLLLDDVFYRMKALAEGDSVLDAARAPEGRSHRNGQRALYLSATPEGCVVATARYIEAESPARGIFPLHVSGARVVDLRDAEATAALDIDATHRATEWRSLRARGLPSPTWDIADRVRALSLDGMLYASRTDTAKTHLTLFRWNEDATAARVTLAGPALPVD